MEKVNLNQKKNQKKLPKRAQKAIQPPIPDQPQFISVEDLFKIIKTTAGKDGGELTHFDQAYASMIDVQLHIANQYSNKAWEEIKIAISHFLKISNTAELGEQYNDLFNEIITSTIGLIAVYETAITQTLNQGQVSEKEKIISYLESIHTMLGTIQEFAATLSYNKQLIPDYQKTLDKLKNKQAAFDDLKFNTGHTLAVLGAKQSPFPLNIEQLLEPTKKLSGEGKPGLAWDRIRDSIKIFHETSVTQENSNEINTAYVKITTALLGLAVFYNTWEVEGAEDFTKTQCISTIFKTIDGFNNQISKEKLSHITNYSLMQATIKDKRDQLLPDTKQSPDQALPSKTPTTPFDPNKRTPSPPKARPTLRRLPSSDSVVERKYLRAYKEEIVEKSSESIKPTKNKETKPEELHYKGKKLELKMKKGGLKAAARIFGLPDSDNFEDFKTKALQKHPTKKIATNTSLAKG